MSDFKAKMHKIRLPLELRADLAGGAYSSPPDLLTVFKGPTSKDRTAEEGEGERKGTGRRIEGRGGEGREGEGPAPNILT